jgi:hypothetical protein
VVKQFEFRKDIHLKRAKMTRTPSKEACGLHDEKAEEILSSAFMAVWFL